MMTEFVFNGQKYRVFNVHAFNNDYPCIVVKRQYGDGGLALEVMNLVDDGDFNSQIYPEPFAVLTVNLGRPGNNLCQFVKNYSENEEWAENLAKAIGGKNSGVTEQTGYVTVPLYDFSGMKLTVD